ncbi:hypothetical protein PYW07_015496 [Mythimna separata]|uniref:Uncharacterized protein n=1 Tax=Mythimna separata TaxID=271217 RepID=A0AAD7Z054_MYTSE|nr:hypothetical protein PYW07_015496 [Mythimna separata]
MDRETWWWDDGVQEATRKKKGLFKKWQGSNSPEDREAYGAAKRACKKAVARARSKSLAPLYDKLETVEGQKLIFKLARAREKATRDISKCLFVRDAQGKLLSCLTNSIPITFLPNRLLTLVLFPLFPPTKLALLFAT